MVEFNKNYSDKLSGLQHSLLQRTLEHIKACRAACKQLQSLKKQETEESSKSYMSQSFPVIIDVSHKKSTKLTHEEQEE